MKDDTSFVWGVNGIPWWYFHNHENPDYRNKKVSSVDPDGSQWDRLGPENIIGCIVNPASEVIKPGVIQHLEGDKFQLGEINGEETDRIKKLSSTLEEAGFQAPIRPNIKGDIWLKLFGNLSLNPLLYSQCCTSKVLLEQEGVPGADEQTIDDHVLVHGRLSLAINGGRDGAANDG